jgi:copper resistance protein B
VTLCPRDRSLLEPSGGVRQDVGSGVRRTYAVVGIEGLALLVRRRGCCSRRRGDTGLPRPGWTSGSPSGRSATTHRGQSRPRRTCPNSGSRRASPISSWPAPALRDRLRIRPYVGVNWECRYGPARGSGAALALGIRSWF